MCYKEPTVKLRTKMFLIFSIIAVIPVLVIGGYSYSRWHSYITNQIVAYSSNVTASAIEQSNAALNRINQTLEFITYYSGDSSTSIVEVMSEFADGPDSYTSYDILTANNTVRSIFSNLMNINEDLQGVWLITADGLVMGTSNDQSSKINARHNCGEDVWYQNTISLGGKNYISTYTSDDLFTDDNPSIYLSRGIYEVYSHKFLGVIVLDLDPEAINLDTITAIPDLTLLYIENTQTGEVLYSNVDHILTDGIQYTDGAQITELDMEPLTLSIRFHYDTLYSQYNPAGVVIILMVAIFIAMLLMTLYLITGRVTFPIERLSRVMKHQRSNQLQFVNPYVGRRDEIGTLYKEYGHMLDEINEGIRRDYQNRLIVLDAQMKALEARINSHFLFNTLESINSMAEIEDNQDIATMSLALGDMFRYAIKTPSELVTLSDELKHVNDYVSIQRIRFSGRFRLVKEIPEELYSTPVLKLILQPLVENALYHGLNYCATGDTITISAVKELGILHITVTDNGVGITPDTLTALRSRLTADAPITEIGQRTGQSIGLKNIHARIQLYYGDIYGLTIESDVGHGTAITITIPIKEQNNV